MDLCALLLELLDPCLHVGELRLQLLNLLRVGADGLVEGLRKQIRHGLWLAGAHGGRAVVHGGRHGAAVGHAADGQRRLLRLLLARVHVGVFGGRLRLLLLLLGFFAAGVGASVGVVVEGLRAGRGFFDVRVGAGRAAFEEHYEERRAARAGRVRCDYMAQQADGNYAPR